MSIFPTKVIVATDGSEETLQELPPKPQSMNVLERSRSALRILS